jgi:DNA invertase Pin-like site-specific DNA recombinase
MVRAYSYIRFSSKKQAAGDSLRRQTEQAEAYCQRRGWTLSEDSYQDLGVSARRGKNALVGNLGEFLKAVRSGAVRSGSALIVESFDRITRQGIDEGWDLIKSILKADILIVTVSPEREFDVSATKSLSKGALEIQLILERAAEENERRAERVRAAWLEKKRRARAGEYQRATEAMGADRAVMTRQLPVWIRLVDGKPERIPEKVKAIKLVFRLAAKGYGVNRMAAKLNRDKVPPISGKVWTKQFVARLIADRRLLGEAQLYGPGRKPEGAPVPDYFPRVVSDDEWAAARAGAKARKHNRGPSGGKVNLFMSIIKDARDGGAYFLAAKGRTPTGATRYVLQNLNSTNGLAKCTTFPYDSFETAILYWLAEVDPVEVIGVGEQGPNPVDVLEGQLSEIMVELTEINGDLEAGRVRYSAMLANRVADLEDTKGRLERELEVVRHAAAHPLEEAWRDAKSLLEAVESAADQEEARLRLRAVLRRTVEAIYLLVVVRGIDRIAAVQVRFKGNGRTQREYLMWHRRPVGGFCGRKPASVRSVSIHSPWPGIQDPESDLAIGLCPLDMSDPSEDGWRRMELQLSLSDKVTEEMFFKECVTHDIP